MTENNVNPAQPTILTARLRKSVLLSGRTKHLEFEVEDVASFDYAPGQFVSVREPREGGKFITRAYSIASAPVARPIFHLCVNRVDEGFMSNYLCDLSVGAPIHFHGPYGQLTMAEPPADSVFVATGTGVAPFRAMIEQIFSDDAPQASRIARALAPREYWLVFGARTEDDILYRRQFAELAARWPNFHYVLTLSRAADSWAGKRGHVEEALREIVAGRDDMRAYLCGLGAMVTEVRKMLKEELHWEKSRIIAERYN